MLSTLFEADEVLCAPKPAAAVSFDSLLLIFVGLIRVGREGSFSFSSMRGFPDIGLVLVLRFINGFRDGADVEVLARDIALPGRRGCANEARGASSSSEESLSEVVSDVSLFGTGDLTGIAVKTNVRKSRPSNPRIMKKHTRSVAILQGLRTLRSSREI